MTDEARAKIFKTTVIGIGPWCIEFSDGEIITCRTEERARQIADMQALAAARAEEHQRRLETVAMCEQLKQELAQVRAEERKKVFLEVAQKCNPNGLGPENRSWHALNGWAFIEDWCRQQGEK